MKSQKSRRLAAVAVVATGTALFPQSATAATVSCRTGADGTEVCTGATDAAGGRTAPFRFEMPQDWNGTLLIWSRGGPNPTPPMPGPLNARTQLLAEGYALLASTYSNFGWAVEEGPADQMAALDVFEDRFGEPGRTIAWGGSLGGVITGAIVDRYPDRIDGAIPYCHGLAGTTAQWNQLLDATFVVDQLIATDRDLELVDLPAFPAATPDADAARSILEAAQGTPEGRARIALAAAMNNAPLWVETTAAQPEDGDHVAQQRQMYAALQNAVRLGMAVPRQELEHRAGGNFSWNAGVDYRRQLVLSGRKPIVEAMYRAAGLDLEADLSQLAAAPRIEADADAVAYTKANIAPSGAIDVPVLTMDTIGDASALAAHAGAYAQAVRGAGNAALLRQAFVGAPGHCTFSAPEYLAALHALEYRLDTGRWADAATPDALNAAAASSGAGGPARFVHYVPDHFLRPCDADEVCPGQP